MAVVLATLTNIGTGLTFTLCSNKGERQNSVISSDKREFIVQTIFCCQHNIPPCKKGGNCCVPGLVAIIMASVTDDSSVNKMFTLLRST